MVAAWPAAAAVLAFSAASLAAAADVPVSLPLRPRSQRAHHPDPAVRAAFARDEALYHRLRFAARLGPAERAQLDADVAHLAHRRDDLHTTPLLDYNFDMGYAVSVSVGTPPQTFDVVADTGSHDFVLFDRQCPECNDGRLVFEHTNSSTFTNLEQDVYQAYGTGDARGVFVTDRVVMGGFYVEKQPIALILQSTVVQYMGDGISGIMGFSWPSLDSTVTGETFKAPMPMWQALAQSSWEDKQFGMWLGRANPDSAHMKNNALVGSVSGMGDLSLGGLNTSLYTGKVTYYDATVTQWWQIPLYSYTLNGKEVAVGATGAGVLAVIDSGATGIMMPQEYAAAFYEAITGSMAVTDPKTGQLVGQWAVPCNTKASISFKFGGAAEPAWTMSVADLLRAQATTQPTMCFGTVQTGEWLLGAAFMKNVYTAFRYQPPQVGFAALNPAYDFHSVANSSEVGGGGGGGVGKPGGGDRSGGGGSGPQSSAVRASVPGFSAILMALLAFFCVG